MAETGGSDLTPATVMVDEPTIFKDGEKDYQPANYKDEYGGPMTLRRALALSRNIVTIKVAEATGYDRVSNLWKKIGVGTPAQPFPSIALGVFEASPLEMATAYSIFPMPVSCGSCGRLPGIVTGSKRWSGGGAIAPHRAAGHDLPRDEHASVGHQRGHGGAGAQQFLARRRRQDGRHDE